MRTTPIRQKYSEILTVFSSIMQSINEFYWTEKVLLKSLRFTELSHETEVLNMVTEIMERSSQMCVFTVALCWGSSLLSTAGGMCMCTVYQPSCAVV